MSIKAIECSACGFSLPGSRVMYVTDSSGVRVLCSHPSEANTIWRVLKDELCWLQRKTDKIPSGMIGIKHGVSPLKRMLGFKDLRAMLDDRIGILSNIYCLDCSEIFRLDVKRDPLCCVFCASKRVLETTEMVGKTCPGCNSERITERDTGIWM